MISFFLPLNIIGFPLEVERTRVPDIIAFIGINFSPFLFFQNKGRQLALSSSSPLRGAYEGRTRDLQTASLAL
jgi:hypothetical protein